MYTPNSLRPLRVVVLALIISVFGASSYAADRPFLGLQIQEIDERIANILGKPGLNGVMVKDIAFPGPSSQAGVFRGDIIIEVNGELAKSVDELVALSSNFNIGESIPVKILRGNKEVMIDIKVNKMPASWQIERNSSASIPSLGITFVAITEKVRKRFNLGWNKRGVVVSLLNEEKAMLSNIEVGDVIVQVNQRDVWQPSHISSYFKKAQKEDREFLMLLVHRNDGYHFTLMQVPQ